MQIAGRPRRWKRGKEIDPKRSQCSRADRPSGLGDLRWGQVRGADEAERPRFANSSNERRCVTAASHWCLDDGMAERQTLNQTVRELHECPSELGT